MKTAKFQFVVTALLLLFITSCSKKPKVSSVDVTPSQITVSRGETSQFRAEIKGENNPPQNANWTIQGGTNGTIIDANGVLAVAINENLTTLTVTATSTIDSQKSGTAFVLVTSGVERVDVTPATVSVNKGKSQRFIATVVGNNLHSQNVSWTIQGGANGTSIDNGGLLTIVANETAKTITVTATSIDDSGKVGFVSVNVNEAIHPLVGFWDCTKNPMWGSKGGYWIFNNDGSGRSTIDDDFVFRWSTQNNNKLTLTDMGSNYIYSYKISGRTLDIYENGITFIGDEEPIMKFRKRN